MEFNDLKTFDIASARKAPQRGQNPLYCEHHFKFLIFPFLRAIKSYFLTLFSHFDMTLIRQLAKLPDAVKVHCIMIVILKF